MKEYSTIACEEVTCETIIDKSRFIASAIHVDNVDAAVGFVASKQKRYFDATHNCYAYVVGDKAKYSDDGEPQGTAGLPILECIKNSELDFVCVVVTRYFGGKKLGAGGLVRAYSGGCAEVLKHCEKLYMRKCIRFCVDIEYSMLKALRMALQKKAVEERVEYNTTVHIVFLALAIEYSTICDIISEATLGKAEITKKDSLLYNFTL